MEHNSRLFRDARFADAIMGLVRCGDHLRDPSDVAWETCGAIERSLGLDDVILYLTDDNDRELIQTAAAGPKNPAGRTILNPIRIPMGTGICGTVARTGSSEIVSDTTKDARYIVDDAFRNSELTVPLIHADRIIGVLDSESSARNFYTADHLSKLQAIASVASAHIARGLSDIRLENAHRRLRRLQEIADKQAELQLQVADVERWISRLDDDAVRNIHHELRTPLNAIIGLTELLDETACASPGAVEATYIDTIRKSGQSLFERITDLLDLPGLGGPAPTLVSGDVGLVRLLENLAARMTERAADRGLRLTVDAPDSARPLHCDAAALGRIVGSLVDNAIKFSFEGTVLVRLETDGYGVPRGIEVTDSGIGIESRHQRHIFDPFFQVEQGLSRRFGGLGLGLSNARRLCDAMGFELRVSSQLGQGSTFRIDFI